MLKLCVKPLVKYWYKLFISRVVIHSVVYLASGVVVQLEAFTSFMRSLYTTLPTTKFMYFDQLCVCLYPQSTAPIKITTYLNNFIIKES